MSLPTGTSTRAYADLRRAAVLGALFQDSFVPPDEVTFSASIAGGTSPHLTVDPEEQNKLASLCVGAHVDSSPDSGRTRLIASILSGTSHEQTIAALRPLGLGAIADRLTYLHQVTADGDPDEPPMALSSLRQCALFFASESRHADADLGISPDGLLQAQWRPEGRGVLAIRFLPNGFLQFAGVSESSTPAERRRVHGTLPKDQALQAVRPFLPESRH